MASSDSPSFTTKPTSSTSTTTTTTALPQAAVVNPSQVTNTTSLLPPSNNTPLYIPNYNNASSSTLPSVLTVLNSKDEQELSNLNLDPTSKEYKEARRTRLKAQRIAWAGRHKLHDVVLTKDKMQIESIAGISLTDPPKRGWDSKMLENFSRRNGLSVPEKQKNKDQVMKRLVDHINGLNSASEGDADATTSATKNTTRLQSPNKSTRNGRKNNNDIHTDNNNIVSLESFAKLTKEMKLSRESSENFHNQLLSEVKKFNHYKKSSSSNNNNSFNHFDNKLEKRAELMKQIQIARTLWKDTNDELDNLLTKKRSLHPTNSSDEHQRVKKQIKLRRKWIETHDESIDSLMNEIEEINNEGYKKGGDEIHDYPDDSC